MLIHIFEKEMAHVLSCRKRYGVRDFQFYIYLDYCCSVCTLLIEGCKIAFFDNFLTIRRRESRTVVHLSRFNIWEHFLQIRLTNSTSDYTHRSVTIYKIPLFPFFQLLLYVPDLYCCLTLIQRYCPISCIFIFLCYQNL